ncbi:MAG: branched-chain amino acid transport system II carrier protein, partial [Puniceicoccales bacterium]|nr:branched-chain amino acid transport system II carrier protein [Puniceicoccales bacterium]
MNKLISLYFVYGLALFGMFFGAGNLAFPLKIGQITGVHWLSGALGLMVTGIVLPFLGLFVVKLYRGDCFKFFGGAGSLVKSIFPLFALSLIGSFGGIPRCITIAYGGISHALPEFPLWAFSIIFSVIVFFVGLGENRLINVVGKWLTPILFGFLVILIAAGIMHPGCADAATGSSPGKSFFDGLTTGYQTMDLLAAFFFSALVFSQIKKTLPADISDKSAIKIAVKAGILASL